MKVAVMGAGGVGGFFGSKLAQNGVDVTFIARGRHLEELQKKGLRLIEDGTEQIIDPVKVIGLTKDAEPVDVILLAVKLGDTKQAAGACLPLMHDETFLVTLQNGVESVDVISGIVGEGRTIGAAVYVVSNIVKPGVIEKSGPSGRLEFAEPDGSRSDRAVAFEAMCQAAGIDAHLMDDMQSMLWRKFIMLSASSSMTALTRQPMGYMHDDPDAQGVMLAAVRETIAVADALGIELSEDIEQSTLKTLNFVLHSEAKASQLVDLERKKPLELEWLSGAIHRFGQELGVPTPVHSTVYAALKPFAKGRS